MVRNSTGREMLQQAAGQLARIGVRDPLDPDKPRTSGQFRQQGKLAGQPPRVAAHPFVDIAEKRRRLGLGRRLNVQSLADLQHADRG